MFEKLKTGLAALALAAGLAVSAPTAEGQTRRGGGALVARAERVTGDRFGFETFTRAGVRVY